jgi:hypothetical protein
MLGHMRRVGSATVDLGEKRIINYAMFAEYISIQEYS